MSDAPPWTRHLRPQLAALSPYDAPSARASARLHANECAEPWPPEVARAIAALVHEVELGRYPDTSGHDLRALLARLHDVDPTRVVLGNGSDEIIGFLLTALSGPPSQPTTVVVPTPTFVMYGHSARVIGLDVVEVPLRPDLQLDGDAMRLALKTAGVCFLARPNNPTSTLWDAALVRALIAEHPATIFVIDEAYAAYAPGSSMSASPAANQVHMATLSKVGMAALRLGYCVAPPALARALNVVRHPYNISRTSLAIAELVLTQFADVQEAMVARVRASRARLRAILERLPGAELLGDAANFVLVRLAGDGEATRVAQALRARAVLVKDVSATPLLRGCLRVTVGTAAELDLLEQALTELGVLTGAR
ncbi:MAG: histidinol-phosphate transaminase [Nannocystaceae bacterium]